MRLLPLGGGEKSRKKFYFIIFIPMGPPKPVHLTPAVRRSCSQSEVPMTIQTLRFKLVHVSAQERLHAYIRFKLVHVAENVQQPQVTLFGGSQNSV